MAQLTNYHQYLVQIRPQYTDASGRVHENVTWWTGTQAALLTTAQLQAIASAFHAAWATLWSQWAAPNATLTASVCTDWSSASGGQYIQSVPHPGGGVGELAVNTASLIQLKQGSKYKGGHGRVYLPNCAGNITADGVNLVPAAVTFYNANISDVTNAMLNVTSANGGPYSWVIFRQKSHQPSSVPGGPVGPPIPPFTSPVTNFNISPVLATQRRRLRKAPHH